MNISKLFLLLVMVVVYTTALQLKSKKFSLSAQQKGSPLQYLSVDQKKQAIFLKQQYDATDTFEIEYKEHGKICLLVPSGGYVKGYPDRKTLAIVPDCSEIEEWLMKVEYENDEEKITFTSKYGQELRYFPIEKVFPEFVYFKSFNGRYLTSVALGWLGSQTAIKAASIWQLVKQKDRTYCIKDIKYDSYISVEEEESFLNTGSECNDWAKWILDESPREGKYVLKGKMSKSYITLVGKKNFALELKEYDEPVIANDWEVIEAQN